MNDRGLAHITATRTVFWRRNAAGRLQCFSKSSPLPLSPRIELATKALATAALARGRGPYSSLQGMLFDLIMRPISPGNDMESVELDALAVIGQYNPAENALASFVRHMR